jgi:hypothetical protein
MNIVININMKDGSSICQFEPKEKQTSLIDRFLQWLLNGVLAKFFPKT